MPTDFSPADHVGQRIRAKFREKVKNSVDDFIRIVDHKTGKVGVDPRFFPQKFRRFFERRRVRRIAQRRKIWLRFFQFAPNAALNVSLPVSTNGAGTGENLFLTASIASRQNGDIARTVLVSANAPNSFLSLSSTFVSLFSSPAALSSSVVARYDAAGFPRSSNRRRPDFQSSNRFAPSHERWNASGCDSKYP